MKRHSDTKSDSSSEENKSSIVGRRTYLKLAGAAAIPAVASGSAAASTTHRGIEFENVVNLVDDYGADPTGSEPVDDAVKSAASADTLVMVPDGEYLFSDEVIISPNGNVGFLAKDGANPSFVAADGFNDYLINVVDLPEALFEGIDIDITKTGTTAGLRLSIHTTLHVQDVEYVGRGTHPDSAVTNALTLELSDSDGEGIVRNVTALKGSAIGHYKSGDGRVAVRIGRGTEGTIRIEDCHFEEFGNNALYTSRTPGTVEVVRGVYRNNNGSGVRIGGETSYVKDALIEVDLEKYSGPPVEDSDAHNTRAILLEQKDVGKTPGATVRNCDIVMRNLIKSNGAIQARGDQGETEYNIVDTTVEFDDEYRILYADQSTGTIDNLTVTGSGANRHAFWLRGTGASGTSIRNSCFEQTGDDRDGVWIDNADDCIIEDSNINTSGEEILVDGGSVSTSNVTYDQSCPIGSSLAVSTDSATDVGDTSATLNGELTDLGGASSADVYFEWRESGTSSWNATAAETLSTIGTFSENLSSLDGDTDYEFRAVAKTADTTDTGSTTSFTTGGGLSASTDAATNETDSSATLNGELSELTGYDTASVYFEWGKSGDELPNTTEGQTVDSATVFDIEVSGLDSSSEYEFQAVAEAGADVATGDVRTFSTDGSAAPVIDQFDVTDTSNPAWTRFEVDWVVSDDDADLDVVGLELTGPDGTVVDSTVNSVSGSTASGSDELGHKFRGTRDHVLSITVTDSAGNETTESRQFS
jgi:hypothetical protein